MMEVPTAVFVLLAVLAWVIVIVSAGTFALNAFVRWQTPVRRPAPANAEGGLLPEPDAVRHMYASPYAAPAWCAPLGVALATAANDPSRNVAFLAVWASLALAALASWTAASHSVAATGLALVYTHAFGKIGPPRTCSRRKALHTMSRVTLSAVITPLICCIVLMANYWARAISRELGSPQAARNGCSRAASLAVVMVTISLAVTALVIAQYVPPVAVALVAALDVAVGVTVFTMVFATGCRVLRRAVALQASITRALEHSRVALQLLAFSAGDATYTDAVGTMDTDADAVLGSWHPVRQRERPVRGSVSPRTVAAAAVSRGPVHETTSIGVEGTPLVYASDGRASVGSVPRAQAHASRTRPRPTAQPALAVSRINMPQSLPMISQSRESSPLRPLAPARTIGGGRLPSPRQPALHHPHRGGQRRRGGSTPGARTSQLRGSDLILPPSLRPGHSAAATALLHTYASPSIDHTEIPGVVTAMVTRVEGTAARYATLAPISASPSLRAGAPPRLQPPAHTSDASTSSSAVGALPLGAVHGVLSASPSAQMHHETIAGTAAPSDEAEQHRKAVIVVEEASSQIGLEPMQLGSVHPHPLSPGAGAATRSTLTAPTMTAHGAATRTRGANTAGAETTIMSGMITVREDDAPVDAPLEGHDRSKLFRDGLDMPIIEVPVLEVQWGSAPTADPAESKGGAATKSFAGGSSSMHASQEFKETFAMPARSHDDAVPGIRLVRRSASAVQLDSEQTRLLAVSRMLAQTASSSPYVIATHTIEPSGSRAVPASAVSPSTASEGGREQPQLFVFMNYDSDLRRIVGWYGLDVCTVHKRSAVARPAPLHLHSHHHAQSRDDLMTTDVLQVSTLPSYRAGAPVDPTNTPSSATHSSRIGTSGRRPSPSTQRRHFSDRVTSGNNTVTDLDATVPIDTRDTARIAGGSADDPYSALWNLASTVPSAPTRQVSSDDVSIHHARHDTLSRVLQLHSQRLYRQIRVVTFALSAASASLSAFATCLVLRLVYPSATATDAGITLCMFILIVVVCVAVLPDMQRFGKAWKRYMRIRKRRQRTHRAQRAARVAAAAAHAPAAYDLTGGGEDGDGGYYV